VLFRVVSALFAISICLAGDRDHYLKKDQERRILWDAKEYGKAVALLEELRHDAELMKLEDVKASVLYNLACGYSLLKQNDQAIAALREAISTGQVRSGTIDQDPDLDHIRHESAYVDLVRKARELSRPPVLEWATYRPVLAFNGSHQPELIKMRRSYNLDVLLLSSQDEYEKLRRLVKWAHDRWEHNGSNEPSKIDPLTILEESAAGKRFRCVEYSTVLAAAANAFGMPARNLNLKTRDVETRVSGAGHVVAEIWLEQFGKWVYADAQFDVIPERNGVPLNAVEFQEAIARTPEKIVLRSSTGVSQPEYLDWVTPYLYYFDYQIDQRYYATGRRDTRGIMLVPLGAKAPTVFQGRHAIRNMTYISDPTLFYAPPDQQRQ
jgi:hypothetical protein